MSREAMTIGSDKEPPVLFYRSDYSQWKDRFLDFIDRQELGEEMLQSLKEGPAEFYINDDPPLTARQEVVNRSSFSEKQNNRIKADKRAISYLLRGMTDEILAHIDSHETAKGLWDALSELMQGSESSARIEVTKSYEGFKAKDGEFLEVTYNRYCRLLNELRKNGIHKSNIEINLNFLNNLKPEWKRFAKNIMQTRDLSEVDIHDLFRNLNPLALAADKKQRNSSSSQVLKVDKERAKSFASFVSFVSRRDMAVGYQQPPVLFCRPHFSPWKNRFKFFIRGLRGQELGDEIFQSLWILESLLEGPTELYINADPTVPPSQEVMDRSSLSEKQKNRIKADQVAKSYLRRGLTNEILACIDSYKTATGMWVELSKQMQGTDIGAHIKMEEIGKCYSCGKTDCYVLQEKQHWGSR